MKSTTKSHSKNVKCLNVNNNGKSLFIPLFPLWITWYCKYFHNLFYIWHFFLIRFALLLVHHFPNSQILDTNQMFTITCHVSSVLTKALSVALSSCRQLQFPIRDKMQFQLILIVIDRNWILPGQQNTQNMQFWREISLACGVFFPASIHKV